MPARTRIKICGVRTVEAARAAVDAGADAIGLVFVEASPRHVNIEQASDIVAALPAFVEPVGLFVDTPAAEIRSTCQQVGITAVQLHGQETPADIVALTGMRILKAVSFNPDNVNATLSQWQPVFAKLAGFLFDAPPPAADELPGGSGNKFDWNQLAQLQQAGAFADAPPVILAGGLTPENVGSAIAKLHPFAVDVSSGVESSRGVKDLAKIAAFCEAVRDADATW